MTTFVPVLTDSQKKRVILPVTNVQIPDKMTFKKRKNSAEVISQYLDHNRSEYGILDGGAYSRVGETEQDDSLYRATVVYHGMINAMLTAFSQHYPLVLRPQHIWIMILQAVSDHVNLNAEALQERWMEGGKTEAGGIQKMTLVVVRDDFLLAPKNGNLGRTGSGNVSNDWASVVCNPSNGSDNENTFLGQIKRNIRPEAHADLLIDEEGDCGLSDTTPIERVCMGITVMTTLQKYFDYSCSTMCGFPYIALEGELSDWIKIRQSAEQLVSQRCTSDFSSKWLPALLPLLDKFVEEYEKGVQLAAGEAREVDSLFWNAMVKRGGISGSGGWSWLTGWMNILFPFINKGTTSNRFAFEPYSPQRAYVTAEHDKTFRYGASGMGPDVTSFSEGLSKVPVTWYYLGEKVNLEFTSGFLCTKQDEETKEISAELMWFITEKGEKSDAHKEHEVIYGYCSDSD